MFKLNKNKEGILRAGGLAIRNELRMLNAGGRMWLCVKRFGSPQGLLYKLLNAGEGFRLCVKRFVKNRRTNNPKNDV